MMSRPDSADEYTGGLCGSEANSKAVQRRKTVQLKSTTKDHEFPTEEEQDQHRRTVKIKNTYGTQEIYPQPSTSLESEDDKTTPRKTVKLQTAAKEHDLITNEEEYDRLQAIKRRKTVQLKSSTKDHELPTEEEQDQHRRTVKLKSTYDTHEIYPHASTSIESADNLQDNQEETPRKTVPVKSVKETHDLDEGEDTLTPRRTVKLKTTYQTHEIYARPTSSAETLIESQGDSISVDANLPRRKTIAIKSTPGDHDIREDSDSEITINLDEKKVRHTIQFSESTAKADGNMTDASLLSVFEHNAMPECIQRKQMDLISCTNNEEDLDPPSENTNSDNISSEPTETELLNSCTEASPSKTILIGYKAHEQDSKNSILPNLQYWFEDEWEDICKRNGICQDGEILIGPSDSTSKSTIQLKDSTIPSYLALPLLDKLHRLEF